jgi:hypothetical protein
MADGSATAYNEVMCKKKGVVVNIEFPDIQTVDPDSFGIAFPADVDGMRVRCLVTQEALQEIDPSRAMESSVAQFEANKFQIQEIAEEKIREGKIESNVVLITQSDIR